MKNHGGITVARHMLQRTKPSLLVVTLREVDERGICSAATEKWVDITEDEFRAPCVVVFAWNKESLI